MKYWMFLGKIQMINSQGRIGDKLNLIPSEKGWYMHDHLKILKGQGKLEKCLGKKGFKLKQD